MHQTTVNSFDHYNSVSTNKKQDCEMISQILWWPQMETWVL